MHAWHACKPGMHSCLAQGIKDSRKLKFPLKSVESSEINEVEQIDHQKISMTESGYNQILVIKDPFTKLAEAVRVRQPQQKRLVTT